MSINPAIREKKSIQLLDSFPWESGATIIGGYSILGYGTLRYSNDLDLAIPNKPSEEIIRWFTNEGFMVEKTAKINPQSYDGSFVRYQREEVTVDLVIGAVRDRDAQIDIPAVWIRERPVLQRIIGLNYSTKLRVPPVRLEALWALKLQAGRGQDIFDLYSVFNRKFSHSEVIDLFQEKSCRSLTTKLEITRKKLQETKTYSDLMSALQIKDNEKNREDWKRFTSTVENILDPSCGRY